VYPRAGEGSHVGFGRRLQRKKKKNTRRRKGNAESSPMGKRPWRETQLPFLRRERQKKKRGEGSEKKEGTQREGSSEKKISC